MRIAVILMALVLGAGVVAGMYYAGLENASEREAGAESSSVSEQTAQKGHEPVRNAEARRQGRPSDQAGAQPANPPRQGSQSTGHQAEAGNRPSGDQAAAQEGKRSEVEVEPIPGLHVEKATHSQPTAIGADQPRSGSPFKMRVRLVNWGAGLWNITLSDYTTQVGEDPANPKAEHYTVLQQMEVGKQRVYPYAARSITVNGHTISLVDMESRGKPIWDLVSRKKREATYRLTLVDVQGQKVLAVERTYRLEPGQYRVQLDQRIRNLSNQPLRVSWKQNAHGDLRQDPTAYLGDRRLIVTGYFNPQYGQEAVYTGGGFLSRSNVASSIVSHERESIWPNPNLEMPGAKLAWLASENRYFSVATFPEVGPEVESPRGVTPLSVMFPEIGARAVPSPPPKGVEPELKPAKHGLMFTLGTDPITLRPGDHVSLGMNVFAGPREGDLLSQYPYGMLNMGGMIRYQLGCTWFTFQWLAKFLLEFLEAIHFLVRDWGVAIIVLVLVVRLILHPITKHSQANMMKMGKRMQTLQPEMEKLKTKYKDDQQKLNQEMMKLYREKGVNPLGALGCLPMLLQTPIWIALYAMLYFAIELRQQPAFYGVFQAVSGGQWPFLANLGTADHFIPLTQNGVSVPVPFINLHFNAINLLPLLMAVVFFFQQKFMTPPAQNEQSAQQQKVMRFMTLLFPIFLYPAPAGLTLYILASTTAGIVDSYLVRRHVQQEEEAGTLYQKKQPKPGGLRERMGKIMEEKQRQIQEQQQRHQKGGGGGGATRASKRRKR